jgi:hypothetical protein
MSLFDETIPVTADQEARRRSIGAAIQSAPNVIASTALTGLVGDRNLPTPFNWIPFTGTAEGIAGGVGGLLDAGSQVANAGLSAVTPSSWGLQLPGAPEWMTAAGQHFGKTQREIEQSTSELTGGLFPKPDETTLPGQIAQIGGTAIGSGIGLFPGQLATMLPRGLQTVGKVLMPSLEHIGTSVPLTTLFGSAQGAIDLAAAPTTAPMVSPTTPTDGGGSLFSSAQAAPAQPTQPTSLFDTGAPTTPAPSDSSGTSLFGAPPPGPTFTQQGETGTPLWAAGATLLTGLGMIFAGRYTHSLGASMDDVGRTARFNNPDYAQQMNDYTNDVISRGPNSGTLLPTGPNNTPVDAPVPRGTPLHSAITSAADATVNNAAKVQDAINLTAYDPAMGERMSAEAGNSFDRQYNQDLVKSFMATGYSERTGISIPNPTQLAKDWGNLTPAQNDTLAMGLKSLDEINTRDYNTMLWNRDNPGVQPSLEDVAHNLMGKGTDELRGYAAAMQADPQLADIAMRYKQITDGIVDIGEHPNYGFFPAQEAAELKRWRSNYVPEMDINGKQAHPFGPRETSILTGQAQIMTHPVLDLMQHLEAIIPQFERNLFNQEQYYHWKDVQRAYPQSAQFMTDVGAPTGAHASYYPQGGLPEGTGGGQFRDPIVAIRTPTGTRYARVDNTDIYGAMTHSSLSAARIQLGAANTAKRLFQQGTTSGISGIMTQRIVPGRTALFSSMLAPVNLPRNMRAGMLDYAVQRAYGGAPPSALQSAARGADVIGNIPGVVGSYALGVGDRRIRDFANYFAPTAQNSANRWVRAMAGDAPVDALHQMAQQRWENSGTKAVEAMHVGGSGSPGVMNAPGVRVGTRAGPQGDVTPQAVRLQVANLAPKAFYKADWAGAKPFFMYMRNAVAEGFDHMASAGQEYAGRLNIDNPNVGDAARTYAIRNMFGNPGRMGSSPLAQKASGYVPWLNIAAQELASTGSALGKNPFGVAGTIATGIGTLAAIQLLTHMRSQQHMDFLQNQISTQQREANIYLALNSDPTKPTVIPLPRSLRLANAFMLDVVSKAINYIGARHDLNTFNGVWEGLKDFLGSHITTSDAMAMRHAGVDMMDVFNLPPYLGHLDYNRLIQNGISNAPSAFSAGWSGPVDKTMPDQSPATAMDSKTGEVFRNILTNVFGAAAASGWNGIANVSRYQTQGHSFLDSIGMGLRDWIQGLHEGNLSANNLLFETPIRLSKQPPIAEALEPTLFGLKNLPTVQQPATQGFTGGPRADQLPIPLTGQQPVSNDPLVAHMLIVAHGYKTSIDQAMAPINLIKAQMGAVDKQGMDPETKRNWMNQQTRAMADRYKLVNAYASDMYYTLSKLSGTTINNLNQIDWQKDRSQFQ